METKFKSGDIIGSAYDTRRNPNLYFVMDVESEGKKYSLYHIQSGNKYSSDPRNIDKNYQKVV